MLCRNACWQNGSRVGLHFQYQSHAEFCYLQAMRRPNPQVSEFELVPSDLEPPTQKDKDSHQSYDRRKWRPAMLWNSRPAKYFFYTVPLLIAIVPVVVLLAFSAKLSHRLGSNGCTPSGDFVIPFTSSIVSNPPATFCYARLLMRLSSLSVGHQALLWDYHRLRRTRL